MEIGKEIKQTVKFSSEYHKMSVNILYTASWLNVLHATQLKPFGITSQQFNILRILRGQHPNPATINMLIERMIDKSSNASRLVDRLQEKLLADRCTCDSDKRSVNVRITDKGLEVLKLIELENVSFENELKTLSKDEAAELSRLLDKLRG